MQPWARAVAAVALLQVRVHMLQSHPTSYAQQTVSQEQQCLAVGAAVTCKM
jgi:hypothetical protein